MSGQFYELGRIPIGKVRSPKKHKGLCVVAWPVMGLDKPGGRVYRTTMVVENC